MEFHILDTKQVTQSDFEKVKRVLPSRFERSKQFLFEKDRLLCIGSGALMINHLGITSESDLMEGEFGKPAICPDRIGCCDFPYFNVSHSGNRVILACDGLPVGADIEEIEERNLKVARRVYTEEELDWMSHDPIVRFHLLWTQKEAVMKATGFGMRLAPESFCVMPFELGDELELHGERWRCESWIDGDYAISICTRS